MTMNCRYTCISLYKFEYSIPEENYNLLGNEKYVAPKIKFPKTENTRKQMYKSQRQKGQTINSD